MPRLPLKCLTAFEVLGLSTRKPPEIMLLAAFSSAGEWGPGTLRPKPPMEELSPADQQVVEMTIRLISQAARFLIDEPDALTAEIQMHKGKPVLVLRVPESDMRNLIGHEAKTAEALRILTDALAARLKVRLTLLIESASQAEG